MNTRFQLIHKTTLLWAGLLMFPAVNAQGPWTRQAIELAQAGQLDPAEQRIEMALDRGEGQDPLTWYVKAFVLKSRFVEQEGRHPNSPLRTRAIDACFESVKRDPDGRLDQRRAPLFSYLADTHLEDARDAIQRSQPDNATEPQQHFQAYARIQKHLDPDWEETPDAVLLDQQLAEYAFQKAAQEEAQNAGPWFAWGKTCYENALLRQHDLYRSEYNLAVHTYNQGVRQFKAAENDLDAIDGALSAAANLWQAAAEGLERAIDLDANQPSGYEALAVVSEALLKQDKIEWCKAHLVELGKR